MEHIYGDRYNSSIRQFSGKLENNFGGIAPRFRKVAWKRFLNKGRAMYLIMAQCREKIYIF
jgi:hypothetical protein